MSTPSVAVILVAAGSGLRLGRPEPKAFVPLGDGTLLSHAVSAVLGMREPAQLVVVVPADRVEATRSALQRSTDASTETDAAPAPVVVAGGELRQDSVAAGLAAVAPEVGVVLVHDAARALTPSLLFDEVAAAVHARGHGVVPGLPVIDTVKRVADGRVVETVDRAELAAVQTPQGFPRGALERAYRLAGGEFTDDAALAAAAGVVVDVVPGDVRAFKITVPADLRRAEQLVAEADARAEASLERHGSEGAAQSEAGPESEPSILPPEPIAEPRLVAPRVGTGVDVHAFADDETPLWLAGLEWPGERGLAGHSDGDAASHAICDALLAAAGLGDVGRIFGTADPALGGAHGEVFLRETVRLVREAGFEVGNVSVQIVGNRPKLAPRREEAEALLGRFVGAPVSVSATTSDGLGFTGRGEGIAAIATAVLLPV
ncbi:2-C-methyl-D-erythritol 4-phosphate cytidylyltransferase [Agromyces mediolanus]|uniref:2-C-methyl-D-erythritol 4-phosphate cytidylyltransferase n=1 Tax=Agromyces mediolanus TaxID=41986 RepID=UPI003833DB7D